MMIFESGLIATDFKCWFGATRPPVGFQSDVFHNLTVPSSAQEARVFPSVVKSRHRTLAVWFVRTESCCKSEARQTIIFLSAPAVTTTSRPRMGSGAHTVGLADGGQGLPILGWSTVAGDLRVPHFIGMHALQILPLLVLGMELLARRVRLLTASLRLRLVRVAVPTYAATIVVLTWQALAGQSVVQPSGAILWVAVLVAVAAVGTVAVSLLPSLQKRLAPAAPQSP